jgi:hypothetical protein
MDGQAPANPGRQQINSMQARRKINIYLTTLKVVARQNMCLYRTTQEKIVIPKLK